MPDLFAVATVTRVDVLRIVFDEWKDWGDWSEVPSTVLGSARDQRAQEVAALVVALPQGEQMRCFDPVYGLRVWADAVDHPLGVAVFCFDCHKAGWASTSEPHWFGFNADSESSRLLQSSLEDYDNI